MHESETRRQSADVARWYILATSETVPAGRSVLVERGLFLRFNRRGSDGASTRLRTVKLLFAPSRSV